jgi:hypothetical protein
MLAQEFQIVSFIFGTLHFDMTKSTRTYILVLFVFAMAFSSCRKHKQSCAAYDKVPVATAK